MNASAKFAKKGSQRWLQVAIERAPALLDVPLRGALDRPNASIEWLSPLRRDGFQEYRDGDVLLKCDLGLKHRPLADFWPAGGPMWDALGKCSSEVLLVEAKAHIPEIVSPRTRATEPARGRIRKSMEEAQKALAPKSLGHVDWTGTFYQYANRVAHLHFLRDQNRIPAHLVNVYFVNATDVGGPSDVAEWKGALTVVKSYLGLGRHRMSKYMHDVFVDVRGLAPLADAEE
jgi:hypothetical protein